MQPIAGNRNQDQVCFESWSNWYFVWHTMSVWHIMSNWHCSHKKLWFTLFISLLFRSFFRSWKTLVPCRQRRNWAHVYLVLDEHFEHLNNVLKCHSDTGPCTVLYSKVQIGTESCLSQILKFYTPTSNLTLWIVYTPNFNR